MRSKAIRGVVSIFSAQVGFLLVGVAITPILVRILGPNSYGEYAFLLSLILVLMIFANAGIFDGARKYLAEDRSVEGWQDSVFGYYFRLAALFAVVIAAGIIAVTSTGLTTRVIDPNIEPYLYLVAAVILVRQFFYTVRAVLMGIGLEQYGEPLRVVKQLTFAVSGLSLAYIGYGITGVLAGHIISHAVIGVVGFVLIGRHLDLRAVVQSAPPALPTREMLSFNGWTVAFMALLFSLYHVDVLMLQPFAGSDQTGYYKAALVIAEFLWIVPIALQLVLLQSSSELSIRGQQEQLSRLAAQAVRYTLLLTVLLALGITALAEPFVMLYYGAEFRATVGPLLLLLPGAIGFALARPVYSIAQGMGRVRILVVATAGAALLNVVLNLILIPLYGMYGAAVGTSVGYGSMFAVHVIAARHIGYNPITELRLPQITLTVIISAPVIVGSGFLIESSLLSLLVVPPLGASIYLLAAVWTDAVSVTEIAEFTQSLPEPFDSIRTHIINLIP